MSLQEVYDAVPDVACKGLCYRACSHIPLFPAERRHLRSKGIPLPQVEESPCRHLDFAGRCSIYEDRPLICRLYGTMPKIRCDYGCAVVMTNDDGHALMRATEALG